VAGVAGGPAGRAREGGRVVPAATAAALMALVREAGGGSGAAAEAPTDRKC
jgi:hypothetical protein